MHIGHSNSLCTQVTRFITNHKSGHQPYHKSQIMLPQAKYRRRFFSREEYANPEMSVCPCRQAPLETHEHVIFEHTRYNGVVGDTLDDIIDFLEFVKTTYACLTI